MRAAVTFLAVLGAGSALAQSITTSGWNKAAVSAETIAAKADTALRNLKDVTGTYGSMLVEPDGSRARSEGKIWVLTPTKFRLEYPFMLKTPRDIDKRILVANGSEVAINARAEKLVNGKMVSDGMNSWVKRTKAGQQGTWSVPGMLTRWHLQAPQHVMLGVGSNAKPFARVLAEARKAGYKVSAETRSTGSISMERIVLRKPNHEMELVFDAKRSVPLTVRTILLPKTPKVTQSVWAVRWNLTPGNKFEAKLFALPAK